MGVQYQFTTPVIARQPANRDAQESNTNVPGRQPVIYQHRSPSTYNHRSPSHYQHRSPSEYQHRSPFIYQDPRSYQAPFT